MHNWVGGGRVGQKEFKVAEDAQLCAPGAHLPNVVQQVERIHLAVCCVCCGEQVARFLPQVQEVPVVRTERSNLLCRQWKHVTGTRPLVVEQKRTHLRWVLQQEEIEVLPKLGQKPRDLELASRLDVRGARGFSHLVDHLFVRETRRGQLRPDATRIFAKAMVRRDGGFVDGVQEPSNENDLIELLPVLPRCDDCRCHWSMGLRVGNHEKRPAVRHFRHCAEHTSHACRAARGAVVVQL